MILDLFIYIIQFYINQNTFLPGFIIRKRSNSYELGLYAFSGTTTANPPSALSFSSIGSFFPVRFMVCTTISKLTRFFFYVTQIFGKSCSIHASLCSYCISFNTRNHYVSANWIACKS